tara:strand:+ start:5565 stop:5867 length:303 start_codon:yes stop_codon:yes gene_type:complete
MPQGNMSMKTEISNTCIPNKERRQYPHHFRSWQLENHNIYTYRWSEPNFRKIYHNNAHKSVQPNSHLLLRHIDGNKYKSAEKINPVLNEKIDSSLVFRKI